MLLSFNCQKNASSRDHRGQQGPISRRLQSTTVILHLLILVRACAGPSRGESGLAMKLSLFPLLNKLLASHPIADLAACLTVRSGVVPLVGPVAPPLSCRRLSWPKLPPAIQCVALAKI